MGVYAQCPLYKSMGRIGYKHTEEAKKRISEALRLRVRKPVSKETCLKISNTLKERGIRPKIFNGMLGKHLSEERKEALRLFNTGRPLSEEHKKKLSETHKGKKQSPETIAKRMINVRGEKHWNWKGGISGENNKIRHSIEYKKWRTSVYERDNYTCVFCGQVGGKLNADHIKPFADFPELRFDIDNGRTVCISCHRKHGENWGTNNMNREKVVEMGKRGGASTLRKYGLEHFSKIGKLQNKTN